MRAYTRAWVLALTGVGGLVGAAAAQTVGPDVIVAELSDLTRWGESPDGLIQSYSVGTNSCNIGNQNLQWNSSTGRHPVIAQNMYRVRNGRFEQLGQSWAKWAFVSVNSSGLCGTCQNPGTGSLMGPNCSDPYSASLNGSQGRLGPKSVINGFTGAFPVSHASPGTATISGRLQVKTADLDPTAGVQYFVEGQYIAADDAAAGNARNNASYRRIWLTGTGNKSITFNNPGGGTSSTVRQSPAIEVWKSIDPTVVLKTVDISGEGRFYIGWKATDLGSRQWSHEFAIFNLNSDRGVGAVKFKLPVDATASGFGFRDVDYHSGEPYSGTDWTQETLSDGVRWFTQTFAQNANANALRWGTLYNFRFTANVSPQRLVGMTLELFKPGTPTTVDTPLGEGCPGDTNGDVRVDQEDLSIVLFNFLDVVPAGTEGDVNGDGRVNQEDLDIVLFNFACAWD